MKRLAILALLAALATSCGGAAPEAAAPTAKPAPDLFVVQPGELPTDFGFFTTPLPWRMYPGIPQSPNVAYYEIYQGGDRKNEVGNISIVRYDSAADLESAHNAILKEMTVYGTPNDIAGLGEHGISTAPTKDWDATDVLFERCLTIVHFSIPQPVESTVAYAKQLDQRITKAVCPEK